MPTPSLVNIPFITAPNVLFSQIPESGAGDFTVTRTTSPVVGQSTRVNAAGLIELVADNVPRLDYPLGGAVNGCPALLVEPSAQNIFQRSEEFNNAYWSKLRCTASPNQTTAPDGTLTADKLIMNNGILPTANDMDGIYRNEVITSGAYRFSIFAKAAEFTGFKVRENEVNGNFMDVNLTNGAITSFDANHFISPLAQNYGNGWYRISWTSPTTITNLNKYSIRVGLTGDGSSGIFIWGYQVETGSIATSYIPTAASPVTRGAETISKTGVRSLIGQTEGTIYIECQSEFETNDIIVINTAGQSPGNNFVSITKTPTTNVFRLTVVAPGTIILIDQASSITSFAKIAVAYASGNTAFFINGTQIGSTNTTGFSFNAALNNITFISNMVTGTKPTRIRSVALYPNRLPNVAPPGVLSLQSLTAI